MGPPCYDFHDESVLAGPSEVPLSSPVSLRPPSCSFGMVPSNGALLASLGDGVLVMTDGPTGFQKVCTGTGDLDLLGSWFFGQAWFGMGS